MHVRLFGAIVGIFIGAWVSKEEIGLGGSFLVFSIIMGVLLTYVLWWIFVKKYRTFKPNRDFSFGLSRTNRCILADLCSAAAIGIAAVAINMIADGQFITSSDNYIGFNKLTSGVALASFSFFS